jgi:hypothetical protein
MDAKLDFSTATLTGWRKRTPSHLTNLHASCILVSMTTELTVGQKQDGLVIRKARKPHRCDHWEPAGEAVRGVLPRAYCKTPIRPGDRYLEYLGESPAFHSGAAYCTEHAQAEWDVEL